MSTARRRFAPARLGVERCESRTLLAIDVLAPGTDLVPDHDLPFVTAMPTGDMPAAPSFSAGFAESDPSKPWIAAAAEGATGAIVYWLKLSVHEGVTTADVVPIWGRLNALSSPPAAPGDPSSAAVGGLADIDASIDGLVFGGPGSALAAEPPLTFADLAGFTPPEIDGTQEYFVVARSASDFALTALTAAFVLANMPVGPDAASDTREPSGVATTTGHDPTTEDPLPAPVAWLQRLKAERPFAPVGDPTVAFPVTAASPAWLIDAQKGDPGAIVLWVTEQVVGGVASFRAVPVWVRFNPASSVDPWASLWTDAQPGTSSVVVYADDGQTIVAPESGPQPFESPTPESPTPADGVRTAFVVFRTESNLEIALTSVFLVLFQAPAWATIDPLTGDAGFDPLPLAGGIADDGQPLPLAWLRGLTEPPTPAPAVSLVRDTGLSAEDRITRTGRLAVDTDPGFRAQYSTDGGETWRRSFRARPGENVVLVRQVNRDGLTSPATTFEFTLDRRRPAAPRLGLGTPGTGAEPVLATAQGQFVVSGVEPGAQVEYSVQPGQWATAFGPEAGINSVRVRQIDAAGNVSRPSLPMHVWRAFAAGEAARSTPTDVVLPRWWRRR